MYFFFTRTRISWLITLFCFFSLDSQANQSPFFSHIDQTLNCGLSHTRKGYMPTMCYVAAPIAITYLVAMMQSGDPDIRSRLINLYEKMITLKDLDGKLLAGIHAGFWITALFSLAANVMANKV